MSARPGGLISPEKAMRLIARHCRPLGTARVSIDDALGHVIAEDVRAPIALPPFDNTAMDGYALRSGATTGASRRRPVRLRIAPSVYAGDTRATTLAPDAACRIMTGAAMPGGADAVIPVEQADVDGDHLVVTAPVARGRHVRRAGDDVAKGARVVRRGALIHPGSVAALAAVGKATVRVQRRPRVAVVSTGDETVAPGERLRRGQIYDSNTHMIAAALRQSGLVPARVRRVDDHPGRLRSALGAALATCDAVIVLGGVSVGDRDHVRRILGELGVREVFWRVAQKPGKPLYFGVKGRKAVFGLPGNPASAFTCFYVYVRSGLLRAAGRTQVEPISRLFPVGDVPAGDPVKWLFQKARLRADGSAERLAAQGSHMVTALADTDGLIVVPPTRSGTRASANLDVIRLPFAEDRDGD